MAQSEEWDDSGELDVSLPLDFLYDGEMCDDCASKFAADPSALDEFVAGTSGPTFGYGGNKKYAAGYDRIFGNN